MLWAKQSVAVTVIVGPVLDSTGAEYASAVIGDMSISKNGGTLTAMASTATLTYIANGMYTLVTRTTDLDTLGRCQITCNKATYQMPKQEFMVLPATVFDALVTNATNTTGGLPAATGAIAGLAGTIATTTNITAATGITVATNSDKTGYSLTATTGLGNQTADITGNLSGSVGSVSGAVGSVTGNVGGNVVGSVASVTGNVGGNVVGSVASVVGAVGSVSGAVGSVTGNVGGNVVGSVGSVTGGINTGTGLITNLDALDTAQDAQHSTTQGRLPASLVSGRMDSSVGAMATDTMNAGALSADALAEISARVALELGFTTGDMDTQFSEIHLDADNIGLAVAAVDTKVVTVGNNVNTLLGRITAALFSGITSMADWIRRIARGDAGTAGMATAQTEINTGGTGTFSGPTDALESIRDRGDAAWVTGGGGGGGTIGTGAITVTFTVRDSVSLTPIVAGMITITVGGTVYAYARTDVSGQVAFALDAGTNNYAVVASGYTQQLGSLDPSVTPALTISLVQSSPIPPAPFAGLCNVLFSVIYLGQPVENATVTVALEDENPTVDGFLVSRQITTGLTDADGEVVLTLIQYASFTRGGVYRIRVTSSNGQSLHDRRVTVPTASTANAEDLPDAR